jgi:MYXO-CTERM domain-containing protein
MLTALLISVVSATPVPVKVEGLPVEERKGSSSPSFVAVYGDLAYFVARTTEHGTGLYCTDGTPAGTRLVYDRAGGPERLDDQDNFYFGISSFVVAGGRLFIGAYEPDYGVSLNVSNQPGGGFTHVPGFQRPFSFAWFDYVPVEQAGSRVAVSSFAPGLGLTDGTREGTQWLPDEPAPLNSLVGSTSLARVGAPAGPRYFYVKETDAGLELRVWDPANGSVTTSAGPEYGFTGIGQIRAFQGGVLFAAVSPDAGAEPWFTEGAPETTRSLGDLLPGPGWGSPGDFVRIDDGLAAFPLTRATYGFSAYVGWGELWLTDGTASGTRPVLDNDGGFVSNVHPYATLAPNRILLANEGYPATGLQSYDPGTGTLENLPFSPISYGYERLQTDHRAWFLGKDGGQTGVCSTDGTAAGTRMEVTDPTVGYASPLRVGNFALYSSSADDAGLEPWALDVTTGKKAPIADLEPDARGIFPSGLFPIAQGRLAISTGSGPIVLDPLDGSSFVVHCTLSDGGSSSALGIYATTGKGFVGGCREPNRNRLVQWDGTPGQDAVPMPSVLGTDPTVIPLSDGRILFGDFSSPQPLREWSPSDGGIRLLATSCGYPRARQLAERLVFLCDSSTLWEVARDGGVLAVPEVPGMEPGASYQLAATSRFAVHVAWFVDGGPEPVIASGTPLQRMLLDIRPGPEGSDPRIVGATESHVYFTATGADGGFGFYATDGTIAGTQLVMGWAEPTPNPHIADFAALGVRAFFTSSHAVYGRELWTSLGAAVTTVPVDDVLLGPQGSAPTELVAFPDAGALFFTAWTPNAGRELWVTDGTSPNTRQVADLLPGPGSGNPKHLTRAGDKLYFVARDSEQTSDLWTLKVDASLFEKKSCSCASGGGALLPLLALAGLRRRRR